MKNIKIFKISVNIALKISDHFLMKKYNLKNLIQMLITRLFMHYKKLTCI